MDLVAVEWFDAVANDEWLSLDDAISLEPQKITTIGWLIHDDDFKIIVAASKDDDNSQLGNTWCIPKVWTVAIEKIR